VDVVGTLALVAREQNKAGVSLDINVTYTSAAKLGDHVKVVGKVLKMGRSLGFTSVDIIRKSDGALIASGRHTKVFPKSQQ
jgi:acyl-coenzyme A thioesterase 13